MNADKSSNKSSESAASGAESDVKMLTNTKHLRSLFEISDDAIMIFTEDYSIECNLACLELFQISSLDAWRRRHWLDMLVDEQLGGLTSREFWKQRMVEALKSGSVRFECYFRRSNGEKFPADVRMTATSDSDETVVMAIVRDTSERQQMEQGLREARKSSILREKELRLILKHISIPVGVYHASGAVDFLNDEFERVCGYTIHDIPHVDHWWKIAYKTPDECNEAKERWYQRLKTAKMSDGAIPPYDSYIDFKDGRKRLVRVWGRLCGDRIIVLLKDVTIEREAATAARLANKAKTDFISRMSHELRTPLNSIIGFSKLMKMSDLPARDKRNADRIHIAGNHLLALVDEILDISRIESNELSLTFECVNINELLSNVTEILKPIALQNEIGILLIKSPDPLLSVHSDRQRLQQILLNLVSNAIKYNREQGLVHLKAHRVDDHIHIEVRDTGFGIPAEKMNRLFTPFDRLDVQKNSASAQGTGLGLSIAKRLLSALGGELTVQSWVGEGTVFAAQLPASKLVTAPNQSTIATDSVEQLSSSTILYIQDDAGSLALVEQILRRRPAVKLRTASSAKAGMSLAREHLPYLIFLDVKLPDHPGDEVIGYLKSDPVTRTIPVYMLSADAMNSRIEHLKDLGAVGYLTKPLDINEFLEVLDSNLGQEVDGTLKC